MAEWARHDSHRSNDPRTWARRLKHLRSFTRWLQQFEPGTEVPDDAIFGRLPSAKRRTSTASEEIVDLLAAARRLGPEPGLRGMVYETLFGLIASAGLRLSEALSLHIGDVDLQARHADDPANQVRQVAPGAAAPERGPGAETVPLDA